MTKPERKKKKKKKTGTSGLAAHFEPYVWAWFEDNFGAPSPPQTASWPKIAAGKNTLIFSPTGSGKTLAAFLWCVNELFRTGAQEQLEDAVHVLYISPLKALNNDIQKNLTAPLQGIRRYARKALGSAPEIRSEVRTGDTTTQKRAEMAKRPPHILITTPESLYIILATPKFRHALRALRYVVIDEIHAMSDNKRGVHLSLSLERLQEFVGHEFVRIGLSATQRPLEEIARFLVGMQDPETPRPCEIVNIGARKDLNVQVVSPVDNLLEANFDAIWGSAYEHMLAMIEGRRTTLVFTNSRYKTERTALRLNELSADRDVTVGAHHGSMSKAVRLEMEDRLKNAELDALVATSSLELGIDVGSIDLVCQVESPKSVSSGMQRIGRAGHLLDATSEGRVLVTDRDDLVECAVLVRAIVDGEIDRTRIPLNCLDILAQHIVGAVAADDWRPDELYELCRKSYCYRTLAREDFDRVLEMLAGNFPFEMANAPFPKLFWDRVNGVLMPERGARMMAYRCSGAIPDIADYDVYFEKRKTRVGQLDEGFVEELRTGDIFILGSSSWRVLGVKRNRVLVEDVYGQAPTIPFWFGERASRTYELGCMVGRFRREMAARVGQGDAVDWLQREYFVDQNGAMSIFEYFREQLAVTSDVPSDELVLIEHFRDELGHRQIIVHTSFGINVNDTWGLALTAAAAETYGVRPQYATNDDGILLTLPKTVAPEVGAALIADLLGLVTPANVDELVAAAARRAPVFASRFRHNVVRALLVLREYRGRKTPVWLQNLRGTALLEACGQHDDFPMIVETLRECLHEALDVASLRQVLKGIEAGSIRVATIETTIPSPFTHSLLLLGQAGEMGAVPARERRSRLMHLHRELLKQILDEETLSHLLDPAAVAEVDARLQCTLPGRRARNANEMARLLGQLGDLVEGLDDEMSLDQRCAGPLPPVMAELLARRQIFLAVLPTAETKRERWVATENLPLFRAAFALHHKLDEGDCELLDLLAEHGPCSLADLPPAGNPAKRLERLVSGYHALRLLRGGKAEYVAARAWAPRKIFEQDLARDEARLELVRNFLRRHGPMTKYEVMARYGFADDFVERALAALVKEGMVSSGEYVPTKAMPQFCQRDNLEEIHRLTLNRLRKEMEPATPVEYADFLVRWQHVHPETRLAGIDGLRQVIRQLEGLEFFQAGIEPAILHARLEDYDPSMLDRLCYGGEVLWRRLEYKRLRRGRVGFCRRQDREWLLANPNEIAMDLRQWDDDIAAECDAVREYMASHDACFFDDIVEGAGIDWRLALRAVWHLVWTGEATNDSYESIRHAHFNTGLSGCYDLDSTPTKKGVTIDRILRHMLEYRKLDPRLGRWAPTERLLPARMEGIDAEAAAGAWAELLLDRHGVVCRDMMKHELAAPKWALVRRALVKLELLGKVRRGLFVEDLSGEQFAWPEAVEALRAAKLRRADIADAAAPTSPAMDEPMLRLPARDPANPFGRLFPVLDEAGEVVKRAGDLIVQGGQPVLAGNVRLLVDLPRDRAEEAVRALMQPLDRPPKVGGGGAIKIANWNGHPIDVSPARHLLLALGFTPVKRAYVYDGARTPDDAAAAAAKAPTPDIFERAGKESAPVVYDADWVVSRSHAKIQAKARELIELLERLLPPECPLVFGPHGFHASYRGVGCVNPRIGQKQLWVNVFHRGWTPGIVVRLETDLGAPEFAAMLLERFEKARQLIDAELS